MRTYNDIYLDVRNMLRSAGTDNFALESKLLCAKAANKSVDALLRDMNLYSSHEVEAKAMDFANRRAAGEPLAYITESWEFYGIDLYINRNVLIPRQDTEVLIDAAKECLIGKKMDARIMDLCCGSGCITVALGKQLPAARFIAVDKSRAALDVARRNIAEKGLSNRAVCMQGDALAKAPMGMGNFDMIICNPPYIKTSEIDTLDTEVKDYEPFDALDGGKDGLDFYRSIIKNWRNLLSPDGIIIFETGEDQAPDVSELLTMAGFVRVSARKDTLGFDRAVIAYCR